MKNLSWFNKIMFVFNIVLAICTFGAYILPFLQPRQFPLLSVITLILPLFFVLNGLFFVYWGLLFKKIMILPILVLLIGITFINKFYKFSSTYYPYSSKDFTIMSYNVRLFNVFRWFDRSDVPDDILAFINEKNPDILCMQEFSSNVNIDLKMYSHKHTIIEGNKISTAQAIFSKFPIINRGHILFPNSDNNVLYADIKKGKDIIRVYNVHLQSLKISPDIAKINENIEAVDQSKYYKLLTTMGMAFKQQQQQAELIEEHKKKCPYPIILCIDMNNSAFSYVYRNIKGSLQDSFEEAGDGFGATYKFKYYPARIDYIFADDKMQVKQFECFSDFENSDHFPIMAKLSIE